MYSSLIQIIDTHLYGFKYSYLILIISTQLYGFKYRYLFDNSYMFAHNYTVSSNAI